MQKCLSVEYLCACRVVTGPHDLGGFVHTLGEIVAGFQVASFSAHSRLGAVSNI